MERRVIPCEKKLMTGLLPWEEGTLEGWSQEAVAEQRISLQVLRAVLCVGPGMSRGLRELRTGQQSLGRSQSKMKHLLLLSASQKALFTLRNTKTKRHTHTHTHTHLGKTCLREANNMAYMCCLGKKGKYKLYYYHYY